MSYSGETITTIKMVSTPITSKTSSRLLPAFPASAPHLFPTSRPLLTCPSPPAVYILQDFMQTRSGCFLPARSSRGSPTSPRGSAIPLPCPTVWTRHGLWTLAGGARLLRLRCLAIPEGAPWAACASLGAATHLAPPGRRRGAEGSTHTGGVCLNLESCQLVSQSGGVAYLPTSTVRDFRLLHILVDTWKSQSLISGIATRMHWCLMGLSCISLMTDDADLFMCFFAICISSLVTSL